MTQETQVKPLGTMVGKDGHTYYVIQDDVGNIQKFGAHKLSKLNTLISLAPAAYWMERFKGPRGGFSPTLAADWLITHCKALGAVNIGQEIDFLDWDKLKPGDWIADTSRDMFDAHSFVMERNMRKMDMELSFAWEDKTQTGRITRIK